MKRFLFACVIISVAALFADEARPPRVDFTSRPEGAKVFIDGKLRGITPLTLFDLKPGMCHLRIEADDYELKDEFFPLQEGVFVSKHIELTPLKGLLLLTTEPAGCTVMVDGFSLGETPRLITTLDAKETWRLLVQKAGYQSRTVDVKFKGRTPLVRHEKLILDSGVLEISSEPSGASVMVNGIARGKTPVTVRDIPKGNVTVTLKLAGHADVTRELSLNAGDVQTLAVRLSGNPGALRLMSVPEGARFYLNDSIQGRGPIALDNVAPGVYKIRAEHAGHESVTKTVTVGNGETVREEFRLESILGRLEIRTQPSGVQVFVNDRLRGMTRGGKTEDGPSSVLTISELEAGEYTVVLKRRGYGEVVKRLKVERKRATPLEIRMKRVFTPNIRIQTVTGIHTGVLVNNGIDRIVIETKPGVNRSFPKQDVRKIEMLTEER